MRPPANQSRGGRSRFHHIEAYMRTIRDEQPGGLLREHARAMLQDAGLLDNMTASEADDYVERVSNHGKYEISAADVVRKLGKRVQWSD